MRQFPASRGYAVATTSPTRPLVAPFAPLLAAEVGCMVAIAQLTTRPRDAARAPPFYNFSWRQHDCSTRGRVESHTHTHSRRARLISVSCQQAGQAHRSGLYCHHLRAGRAEEPARASAQDRRDNEWSDWSGLRHGNGNQVGPAVRPSLDRFQLAGARVDVEGEDVTAPSIHAIK